MGIFGNDAQAQVDLDHLKDRVARLEAAVQQLQLQLPVTALTSSSEPDTGVASDWMAEVRRLKDSGNVIQAIKVYRDKTGLGLKEAKDAVEALY